MNIHLKTWGRRVLAVIGMTILITFACLNIDAAYLSNPIGFSEIGIVASDGIPLPASNEVTIVADGQDPIQIDLKSKSGDFTGLISVTSPGGNIVFQKDYALKYYPNTFFPNSSKWKTFMVPYKGIGTYHIYISQEMPGKADIYIYQGPFWGRILFLPLFATLVLSILSVTFKSKKTVVFVKDSGKYDKISSSKRQKETVLDCKPVKTSIEASDEEVICSPEKKE